ncbi:hypothetical protein CEP54_014415 [Fusarium duplospermum]|uniref:Uncharacterized protein n=1 Tax=Fusarium duplospermum TaxID=1325734 RepID=A0A428NWC7_9HYPO|nr:hypothetical protein CEP54_014415 [Fusarium duplospermum]
MTSLPRAQAPQGEISILSPRGLSLQVHLSVLSKAADFLLSRTNFLILPTTAVAACNLQVPICCPSRSSTDSLRPGYCAIHFSHPRQRPFHLLAHRHL